MHSAEAMGAIWSDKHGLVFGGAGPRVVAPAGWRGALVRGAGRVARGAGPWRRPGGGGRWSVAPAGGDASLGRLGAGSDLAGGES